MLSLATAFNEILNVLCTEQQARIMDITRQHLTPYPVGE
jgi:hypothetical protein